MKVPTMDQLRIQHELAMAGAHAEWEALWKRVCTHGSGYVNFEWPTFTTEQYGRGELIRINTLWERDFLLAINPRDPTVWTLEDFPHSTLADAVSRAVSA